MACGSLPAIGKNRSAERSKMLDSLLAGPTLALSWHAELHIAIVVYSDDFVISGNDHGVKYVEE